MIRFKQGASGAVIKVLLHEVALGMIRAEVVFSAHGHDLWITEVWRAPRPGRPSFHSTHRAFDGRANSILAGHRRLILKDLKAALGADWDVVLHGTGASIHYHMEWQPKTLPRPL